jgi:threonine/homoserine/homoserine lactone efflux protein
MLVVFGAAYVISMAWQIWKYRRLLPENARLTGLLASYD